MDDYTMFWPFSVPMVAIAGAFVYVIVQTVMRARVRELEVRERIAMIERGLVPAPEKDPTGFDRAMHVLDQHRSREEESDWRPRRSHSRYRSAGVTLMGIGFGLMVLITFAAGEPGSGIGVGGFIAVVGFAFFINSLMGGRDYDRYPPRSMSQRPPEPPR